MNNKFEQIKTSIVDTQFQDPKYILMTFLEQQIYRD